MNGRRLVSLTLLMALLAPVALFAGAGEMCDDDCSVACGDCALCAGVAVGPGDSPSLPLAAGASVAPAEGTRDIGAPARLPDPVPLSRA